MDKALLQKYSIKYQVNRSNKQTRSRHKRGLAGRGIFRDYINEYLFPDAEVKPNSGLIFSLILGPSMSLLSNLPVRFTGKVEKI